MYYASVGDAAFLDAIADRASQAVDDVVSSVKSEGERVVQETIATISPSRPAPRVGLSSRVGTIRRAPSLTVAPFTALTDEPRPFGAAPVNGRGPLPLRAAPLPSASSMPSQFGPAPFRAPSTMVAPDLQVVANYNTQAGPRVMQQAPQAEGMSNTTMLIIGGAVLAGLFFFSRK